MLFGKWMQPKAIYKPFCIAIFRFLPVYLVFCGLVTYEFYKDESSVSINTAGIYPDKVK